MPDNLTPRDRRKAMQAVKAKGTRPERRLSSMLAGMSLKGWRRNADDVPGKPDIVFGREQVAIFIDGCFWHGCPSCQRKLPLTNQQYWTRKIDRNIALAKANNSTLRRSGWTVVRIWEHETRRPAGAARVRARIRRALGLKKGGRYEHAAD